MSHQRNDPIERAIDTLREPVKLRPDFERRVMDAVTSLPVPRRAGPLRLVAGWMVTARTVRLSPLGGLAAAALVVTAVLGGRALLGPEAAPLAPLAADGRAVQFVVAVPTAATVALVGDFNDWNIEATPMRPVPGDGVWTVTVPLTAGRYRYSFLVNGTEWLTDPTAPRTMEDDFGRPNSVVTVGGT